MTSILRERIIQHRHPVHIVQSSKKHAACFVKAVQMGITPTLISDINIPTHKSQTMRAQQVLHTVFHKSVSM